MKPAITFKFSPKLKLTPQHQYLHSKIFTSPKNAGKLLFDYPRCFERVKILSGANFASVHLLVTGGFIQMSTHSSRPNFFPTPTFPPILPKQRFGKLDSRKVLVGKNVCSFE